jgi:hypothetical protein
VSALDLGLACYAIPAAGISALSLWLDPARTPIWERIVVAFVVGLSWPWVAIIAVRSGSGA